MAANRRSDRRSVLAIERDGCALQVEVSGHRGRSRGVSSA
jgi:hypothetical protein